jgi:hypothetical protein
MKRIVVKKKEGDVSLPNPNGNRRSFRSLPKPETSGGDFDPFLKASDIGKVGSTGKIVVLGPPEPSESEFSDMTMPVKFKATKYAMGLKTSGGNYSRLFKRFGANPKKWHGAVSVEIKVYMKKPYVAVV